MNVLVYAGPGVAQISLKQALASLKSLLLPSYTVQTVLPDALASNAWYSSCALLVFTGGRDVTYLNSLGNANKHIKEYVNLGGSYLGFCAGAYYASTNIEWEMGRPSYQVSGSRPLQFYPGLSRGCVYPGFNYDSEAGARALTLTRPDGKNYHGLYYNGGGEFVDAQTFPQTSILARYTEEEQAGKVAGVSCSVGRGKAAVWGVHIEYSLLSEPLRSCLTKDKIAQENIMEYEQNRVRLLKDTLALLGLRIPDQAQKTYMRPLPQYFMSTPTLPSLAHTTVDNLVFSQRTTPSKVLVDSHDTFHFHEWTESTSAMLEKEPTPVVQDVEEPFLDGPKHVIVCGSRLPPKEETPLFDIALFFATLQDDRHRLALPPDTEENWGIGSLLLYGEAVTSTQTMIDKNPALMNNLSVPVVSLASHQMSGRGRGANMWLSPAGCLQFSILLRVSSKTGSSRVPYLPATKLVYIQYLMGLAVVGACRDVLGDKGKAVRLKWPNDIYAVVENESGTHKKKLGGIIVSTNFSQGEIGIVIGCGVNVFNDLPTTSLSALNVGSATIIGLETTASAILARFELLWRKFTEARGSFEPFIDEYLACWLHSDEVVTLTTTQPHTPVRIMGLAPDHGLLRTIPLSEEWAAKPTYMDLQPDGNSFDMMAGLIKTKT